MATNKSTPTPQTTEQVGAVQQPNDAVKTQPTNQQTALSAGDIARLNISKKEGVGTTFGDISQVNVNGQQFNQQSFKTQSGRSGYFRFAQDSQPIGGQDVQNPQQSQQQVQSGTQSQGSPAEAQRQQEMARLKQETQKAQQATKDVVKQAQDTFSKMKSDNDKVIAEISKAMGDTNGLINRLVNETSQQRGGQVIMNQSTIDQLQAAQQQSNGDNAAFESAAKSILANAPTIETPKSVSFSGAAGEGAVVGSVGQPQANAQQQGGAPSPNQSQQDQGVAQGVLQSPESVAFKSANEVINNDAAQRATKKTASNIALGNALGNIDQLAETISDPKADSYSILLDSLKLSLVGGQNADNALLKALEDKKTMERNSAKTQADFLNSKLSAMTANINAGKNLADNAYTLRSNEIAKQKVASIGDIERRRMDAINMAKWSTAMSGNTAGTYYLNTMGATMAKYDQMLLQADVGFTKATNDIMLARDKAMIDFGKQTTNLNISTTGKIVDLMIGSDRAVADLGIEQAKTQRERDISAIGDIKSFSNKIVAIKRQEAAAAASAMADLNKRINDSHLKAWDSVGVAGTLDGNGNAIMLKDPNTGEPVLTWKEQQRQFNQSMTQRNYDLKFKEYQRKLAGSLGSANKKTNSFLGDIPARAVQDLQNIQDYADSQGMPIEDAITSLRGMGEKEASDALGKDIKSGNFLVRIRDAESLLNPTVEPRTQVTPSQQARDDQMRINQQFMDANAEAVSITMSGGVVPQSLLNEISTLSQQVKEVKTITQADAMKDLKNQVAVNEVRSSLVNAGGTAAGMTVPEIERYQKVLGVLPPGLSKKEWANKSIEFYRGL